MSLKSGTRTDVVSPRIEGTGSQVINCSPCRNSAGVFTQPRPKADVLRPGPLTDAGNATFNDFEGAHENLVLVLALSVSGPS